MPLPLLKLNLAPSPTFWRRNHAVLGWLSLGAGTVVMVLTVAITWLTYRAANLAGQDAVSRTEAARTLVSKQRAIQERLLALDVEKDLPAWRLAERILAERSLPWSRLTAELERSLVQDVRLRSIQRTRKSVRSVEVKLTGEARRRDAEEAFVESLQQNACFSQVMLEREVETSGGGIEFDLVLSVAPEPPAWVPLPQHGPIRVLDPGKPGSSGSPTPASTKPGQGTVEQGRAPGGRP